MNKDKVIIINEDDTDDDKPECKPTKTKKKNDNKKRKVEKTINTSNNTETLVITQRVKKQKFQCIINLTNICEHREKQKHKAKPSSKDKVNAKEAAKVDKIVPNCARKRCKIDKKRKYDTYFERRHKKESERNKLDKSCGEGKSRYFKRKNLNKSNISTKNKPTRNEPRQRRNHSRRRVELGQERSLSHTGYLSPISSVSLSDVLGESDKDIMSYEDISSDSTTEIDTLIKHTKYRERISKIKGSYDYKYNHTLSSTLLCDNYDIPSAKVTKKHDTHNMSNLKSFKKAELEFDEGNKHVKPVTLRPWFDNIEYIANIPLPNIDKPSHNIEQIIDISNKYERIFTSTPKYENNIENLDASSTDDGTVLTGEMDVVSFHSQGTLVLDYLYSPSHPIESPILEYDAYSPTVSPVFSNNEGIPDHLHCVPCPLIVSLKGDKSYSSSDSRLTSVYIAIGDQNQTKKYSDKLESNLKQEHIMPKVKIEQTSPKIDIIDGSVTNVTSNNFDIDNVKVEADVPEKRHNKAFESVKSYVNIKEEINEDSINNNIKLQPFSSLDLSMRTKKYFEDNNLRMKKEE